MFKTRLFKNFEKLDLRVKQREILMAVLFALQLAVFNILKTKKLFRLY